ncbi:glycerol-3-phosphate dehydrogenase [Desulfosporosinus orientis DSM 765]|uniref:Glycerol-3-phosphate dehydrogenase n=1 Tax=Desulfosporosinus orientis (strain ATCC 19365 / DSM 765 / NCIMB 8382 / VKM B-1628 / Singapore I) TaxID=768706 RepID=G7WD00_DESOD|nr:glycerol-3-phosphate dehydrogenase/oxidase [Desulfosporosinus orientis]AET67195.1 glycerol-3-phosphate dehydrogenase [Desulfosporosinus orientis DSM 765]
MKRDQILAELKKPWDIIVVGGGITGAGVFREGARAGLRCLLLEQRDFAWGTSSRSGKMVHGGLRYLGQGQVKTTWHSVREREKLLRDYKGMVESMGFLIPFYENDRLTPYLLGAGLTVYDLMAFRYDHSQLDAVNFGMQVPAMDSHGLTGGVRFRDARTDDARLVLRVIQEGESLGGAALNYVKVEEVCKDKTGRVQGVTLRDEVSKKNLEVRGQLVINATGVWADELRSQVGRSPRMRRLRGSHLIFPSWRFPLAQALSFFHPADKRSVYVLPWEGITLVGTTDVDHEYSLAEEPHISYREGKYLLEGVRKNFPSLNLTAKDIIATFSGVRPVINTGKTNPSKESRDHVIWNDNGLVTVTGGKMTTFSLLARETLAKVREYIPTTGTGERKSQQVSKGTERPMEAAFQRIAGRYGDDNGTIMLQQANEREREVIPGTNILWTELRWAARHEGVVHLEDLLLRRVRLGLLVSNGGAELMQRIREIVQPELGWNDQQWEHEESHYLELWQSAYSPGLINI